MQRLLNIFCVAACLAFFTACSDDEQHQKLPVGDCFINLAISVSNGNSHSTRANTPTGGEDGDGREAGFDRENAVTSITLILFRGTNQDPYSDADATLELVRNYPVTEITKDQSQSIEKTYTTGPQPLGSNNLDFSQTYYAIVIANAPEVGNNLTEGVSKLSDIRDKVISTVYEGDPTKTASQCTNFVMSSEQTKSIYFASITATNIDGSDYTPGNDRLYDLTNSPIQIERMAARIDFWAANSNGYKTSSDNSNYTTPGYEYSVVDGTGSATEDRFVVTGIVPFNLTNGHTDYGNEYILKRTCADISASPLNVTYLGSENQNSQNVYPYVIDPQTTTKIAGSQPTLTNSLGSVYDGIESLESSAYYHTITDMRSTDAKSTIGDKENLVVCYPMENTLLPASKLYYHATGIAIVGYYYTNGTGTGERRVYLGYLRHRGDAENYDINSSAIPLDKSATMGYGMQYGIVRNNIYRVSINSVTRQEEGDITLNIKVKKWDQFTHDRIYMM